MLINFDDNDDISYDSNENPESNHDHTGVLKRAALSSRILLSLWLPNRSKPARLSILLCLMPDNFTRQWGTPESQWVKALTVGWNLQTPAKSQTLNLQSQWVYDHWDLNGGMYNNIRMLVLYG